MIVSLILASNSLVTGTKDFSGNLVNTFKTKNMLNTITNSGAKHTFLKYLLPSDNGMTRCQKSSSGNIMCPMLYSPVCGHSTQLLSQTFPSSCEACASSNIDYYTSGECTK